MLNNQQLFDLIGTESEAKIISYSIKKGYGFAKTSDGRDVFVSSYHVGGSKAENDLLFGTKIGFKYGLFKDRICATEIKILEKYPTSRVLKFKQGDCLLEFPIEEILKIGVSALNKNPKFLAKVLEEENIPEKYWEFGYSDSDFKVLFIELKNGTTYRFFENGSKITGDGQIDTIKTYAEIQEEFLIC